MEKNWWHQNIVYQIYPQSFNDTNGDGIGDLPGVTQKLDYLQNLGVNTLWLCPTFPSPMKDGGYDVADYQGVNPLFGSLADMDELIAQAGRRDMKILLDLVLNHTSDQHPWFKAALQDPHSKYRDYYIFKPGKNGGPPNNWRSNFGGSAWQAVGENQYYLHVFAPQQPDLNWENPAMREELYAMIHWWMARGVAGFRIDAISFIKKNPAFPSLPPDAPDGLADVGPCCVLQPGIEHFLAEMRDKAFAPGQAFTVAEANGVAPEMLEAFIGENGYFSTVFDFNYTDIDLTSGNWCDVSHFTRAQLRQAMYSSQQAIAQVGLGAPYLENHDQNRSPNKLLQPQERTYEGKTLLATLYFFMQGIPFIYQGQELGMENHPWNSLEDFADLASRDQYSRAILLGHSEQEAFRLVAQRARDNARTPMLWSGKKNAGFTTGKPWLPVHPSYPQMNAEAQQADEKSILAYYRKMAALRKAHSSLFASGAFQPCFEENPAIFAYRRTQEGACALVVCNFSGQAQTLALPKAHVLLGNQCEAGQCAAGQCAAGQALEGDTLLRPLEALVLRCANA